MRNASSGRVEERSAFVRDALVDGHGVVPGGGPMPSSAASHAGVGTRRNFSVVISEHILRRQDPKIPEEGLTYLILGIEVFSRLASGLVGNGTNEFFKLFIRELQRTFTMERLRRVRESLEAADGDLSAISEEFDWDSFYLRLVGRLPRYLVSDLTPERLPYFVLIMNASSRSACRFLRSGKMAGNFLSTYMELLLNEIIRDQEAEEPLRSNVRRA